jgi:hypothetical protein
MNEAGASGECSMQNLKILPPCFSLFCLCCRRSQNTLHVRLRMSQGVTGG